MADLTPLTPLSFVKRGHYGAPNPAITAREVTLNLVSITARKGEVAALAEAVEHLCGLTLPPPNRIASNSRLTLISSGPGQWIVASANADLFASLQPLKAHAALTEQGDGRAILQLSGENLLPMLRKGLTLDLHNFVPGHAAATVVHHISALVWRDGATSWSFAVPRSFAGSFWHWVESSAAEFGLEMV